MKKNHPMNVIIDTKPNSLAAKTDNAPVLSQHGPSPTKLDRSSVRPLGIRYWPATKFHPHFTVPGSENENLSKKESQKRVSLPCPELPHPSVRRKRLDAMLNHARQEAEALAATTPFPSLVLPCLLEEKLEQARNYAARQHQIWQSSKDILCLSA